MAVITKSGTATGSGPSATVGWRFYPSKEKVYVSQSTFSFAEFQPTVEAWFYNTSYVAMGTRVNIIPSLTSPTGLIYERPSSGSWESWPNNTARTLYTDGITRTFNTSAFFNSTNPTVREVAVTHSLNYLQTSLNGPGGDYSAYCTLQNQGTLDLGQKIVLDVPPTATVSAISYDTGYIYAGLTTASVTISDSTAYYGGTVTSIEFTIGNQTITTSGDGTLSIALNTGGVFTPTVVVTDSRGQTYTKTFAPITVNVYTAPSVSFDIERTTSAGVPDDEGTYGLIEATLTFADVIATAVAPSVVLTDDGGTQTTPVVTWYTDGSLATQVTWANVSSGDTVYGLFSGLSTQHSYQVSVRPRDNKGTGTAITQTVGAAFYTIDFYAGGHGIAFGQPATTTGFECNMTAIFKDDATFDDDVLIGLPNYTTSGTTDYDIYTAVVALGWDSDVLVN